MNEGDQDTEQEIPLADSTTSMDDELPVRKGKTSISNEVMFS